MFKIGQRCKNWRGSFFKHDFLGFFVLGLFVNNPPVSFDLTTAFLPGAGVALHLIGKDDLTSLSGIAFHHLFFAIFHIFIGRNGRSLACICTVKRAHGDAFFSDAVGHTV